MKLKSPTKQSPEREEEEEEEEEEESVWDGLFVCN
jgi:ribosomal protein L12E/L44/L45/RPP1/RPP2